jgi:hypothetical protein
MTDQMTGDLPTADEFTRARIARLQAITRQGVTVEICGKTLTMRPTGWVKTKSLKARLMKIFDGPKIPTDSAVAAASSATDQIDNAGDELIAIIAEIFSDEKNGQRLSAEDFKDITAPEIEIVWLAFRECNEGAVNAVGEFLTPIFQALRSDIMGVVSKLQNNSSGNSPRLTPSANGTGGPSSTASN